MKLAWRHVCCFWPLCAETSDSHIANRSLHARTGVDFPMLGSRLLCLSVAITAQTTAGAP
jgi:hypothetical protein